jgi:membrane protease subunit (stomatin/prohibitin family)
MPEVIEWSTQGENDIVYRYPNNTITWGSQLVVREYQEAIFFRDGKAYDVFQAGRHTITTLNLPLLTGILSKIMGYNRSPFTADVIFVSTKQFKGLFGASGQTTDLAPLKFFGAYWFKVSDTKIFVVEVVGGQSAFETTQVNDFLRGYMNERLISQLSNYDLITVFSKLEEVSFKVKSAILDEFSRIGVELMDLKFEGIDTTPEYRERLFWLKQTGAPTTVLQMDTAKSVAGSLSQSPGAGAFSGMVLIPPLMQPQTQAQQVQPASSQSSSAQPSAVQPAQAQQTADTKTVAATTSTSSKLNFCSNCGIDLRNLTAIPKFCPNCGSKLL